MNISDIVKLYSEEEINKYLNSLSNLKVLLGYNFPRYTISEKLSKIEYEVENTSKDLLINDIFYPYFDSKNKIAIYFIEKYLLQILKSQYSVQRYLAKKTKNLQYLDLNDFNLTDEEKGKIKFLVSIENASEETLTYLLNEPDVFLQKLKDFISPEYCLAGILKNSTSFSKEFIFKLLDKLSISAADISISNNIYNTLINAYQYDNNFLNKKQILFNLIPLLINCDPEITFNFLKKGLQYNDISLIYFLTFQTKEDFIKRVQMFDYDNKFINLYFFHISNIIFKHNGVITEKNKELIDYLIERYDIDLNQRIYIYNYAKMPSWVFIKNEKIKESIFVPFDTLTILYSSYYSSGFYQATSALYLFSEHPLILEKLLSKFFEKNDLITSASVESIEFLVIYNIKIDSENFLKIIKNNKFSNRTVVARSQRNLPHPVIDAGIKYYNYKFISCYQWLPIKYIKSNLRNLNVFLLFQFLDDSLQPELEKIRNFEKHEKNTYFFFKNLEKIKIRTHNGNRCNKANKDTENYLCQTCVHLFGKYLNKDACKNNEYQWQNDLEYLEKDINI